jgi:hypothetical protein
MGLTRRNQRRTNGDPSRWKAEYYRIEPAIQTANTLTKDDEPAHDKRASTVKQHDISQPALDILRRASTSTEIQSIVRMTVDN